MNVRAADNLTFASLNDAAKWAVSACLAGQFTAPRSMGTRELLNVSFTLSNPRNRLLCVEGRKWSPALAVGELCWHIEGNVSVEPLAFYAPVWRQFSDDGSTVRGSCYGNRIFSTREGPSSWEQARRLILSDQDTRRAIINVADADSSYSADTKDLSCLQSLHFLVRDGRLHLITHMRSNDAFIGLPYDVFLFTMLHELMSVETGVPLGSYHHIVNSLHLYERDLTRAVEFLASPASDGCMEQIRDQNGLEELMVLEARVREGQPARLPTERPWRDLAMYLVRFANQRVASDAVSGPRVGELHCPT